MRSRSCLHHSVWFPCTRYPNGNNGNSSCPHHSACGTTRHDCKSGAITLLVTLNRSKTLWDHIRLSKQELAGLGPRREAGQHTFSTLSDLLTTAINYSTYPLWPSTTVKKTILTLSLFSANKRTYIHWNSNYIPGKAFIWSPWVCDTRFLLASSPDSAEFSWALSVWCNFPEYVWIGQLFPLVTTRRWHMRCFRDLLAVYALFYVVACCLFLLLMWAVRECNG